uniref:Uncharacterized protein n=1 Tax=Anguilla anguilla TaxID=7936 RepID=A0A0E9TLM5_ANGAN
MEVFDFVEGKRKKSQDLV